MGRSILVGNAVLADSPGVNRYSKTVTITDVNAGTTLVPGFGTVRLRVTKFSARARTAAITGLTLLRLVDTSATPNVIGTFAQANLTQDNLLEPNDTGVALGASFQQALPAGAGIVIDKTGSAAAGGPDIDVTIDYEVVEGVKIMG